jgi:hypothetical protein
LNGRKNKSTPDKSPDNIPPDSNGWVANIKSRTDRNRTKFTDILKDAIQERMNEADSKPARKQF